MQGEFKQCPNGHYYQGLTCPYCKNTNQPGNRTSLKTEVFVGDDNRETINADSHISQATNKTTLTEGASTIVSPASSMQSMHNRTVFGDDNDSIDSDVSAPKPSSSTMPKESRYSRKLVGWLVTYSFDELGVDYKLYEGRNIIGRDMDCNITVNDGRMSGKHAVLLYRANKYSLTDSQSSHGTFVNEVDIELEPRYLNDGDYIRMGKTIFKFRTAF